MNEEEKIILPKGFKRVEYLESTGTQWLETNIKLSNKCKVILDCAFGNKEFKGIYGYDQANDRFAIYNNSALRIDYGGNQMTNLPLSIKLGERYLIERDGNRTYVDGDLILTQTEYEFESRGTAKLFWTGYLNWYATAFKVYRFTIYKEEVCVLNFIPCLDENNIPCMYDMVSQQAFRNQGTGKFLTNKDFEWNYPLINNNYNLPSGFKKCVYLQSDGTQWVDTDVIPDNETGMYFKALQLSYGNFIPFGVEANNNGIYPPRFNAKDLYYKWGTTAIKMMTWDKADDLIFNSSLNLYNSKIAKFDSEDTDVVSSISSQTGTYALPIWLFSYNLNGSYSATYGKWAGRIYRAQITQGDALIHDYVPCLDANGRPCMYDLIESEALYNQSGGTEFAYCVEHQLPSDFVKLKYLEASGTQYIKTGYVPTNTTGLYVDAYCVIDYGTNGVQSSVPMSIRQTNGNTYVSAPRLGKTSSYQTTYGWNSFTSVGGYGDSRYEGYLNWLNNKKYNVKSPLYVEKVGNLSNLSFTPTFDLCMFGNHNYDGKYVGSGYRIYRAKISEGSEIVKDFVPAYDELKQKPCMYDLINNVAYYNDGEGEFSTNKDFEGTYKGFTGLGCISNRLGASEFEWKIPYGYRRVAYLESNGFNKCVINYKPNDNTGYYTHYKCISNAKYQHVLSVSSPSVGAILFTPHYNGDAYNFFAAQRNENGEATRWDIKDINLYEKVKTEYNFFNSKKCYVNGKYLFDTLNTITKPDDIQINLFMYPTSVRQNEGLVGRLYEAKITENDKLLYHFIPCLDPNNKPCMFDIITQQPFYNQGNSEDFTYGII